MSLEVVLPTDLHNCLRHSLLTTSTQTCLCSAHCPILLSRMGSLPFQSFTGSLLTRVLVMARPRPPTQFFKTALATRDPLVFRARSRVGLCQSHENPVRTPSESARTVWLRPEDIYLSLFWALYYGQIQLYFLSPIEMTKDFYPLFRYHGEIHKCAHGKALFQPQG